RVPAARCFSRALQGGPVPGAGQQTLEQVVAAELGEEIRAPPAQAALLAGLAGPRHRELGAQDLVQIAVRDGRCAVARCGWGRQGGLEMEGHCPAVYGSRRGPSSAYVFIMWERRAAESAEPHLP